MVINQSQLGVTTRATEHISIKTNILFDVFHVLVILKHLWIFQLNGIIEFKFNWWSGKWWWAVCYPSNVNGIYHQLISQSHPPGSISWSGKVISGLFSCCWSDKVTLFELLAESADQTKWSDLSCFYQLIRLSDPPWDACTSWSDKMIRLELLIPADQTKWSDLSCLYQLIRQNDPTWDACTSWSDKMIRLEMLAQRVPGLEDLSTVVTAHAGKVGQVSSLHVAHHVNLPVFVLPKQRRCGCKTLLKK